MDKRIFKASEIDNNKTGWVADLSPENIVNPDCYWFFETRKQAETFIGMVNSGMEAREALYIVEANSEAAAILGRSRSPRKAAAVRENGKKGGRPRKIEA
jgi:hypothetical protein